MSFKYATDMYHSVQTQQRPHRRLFIVYSQDWDLLLVEQGAFRCTCLLPSLPSRLPRRPDRVAPWLRQRLRPPRRTNGALDLMAAPLSSGILLVASIQPLSTDIQGMSLSHLLLFLNSLFFYCGGHPPFRPIIKAESRYSFFVLLLVFS